MTGIRRTTTAVILSPVLGAMATFAALWFLSWLGGPPSVRIGSFGTFIADASKFGLFFGVLIGIPITATYGLLAHALLSKFRWTHWVGYGLVGMVGGVIPPSLLFSPPSLSGQSGVWLMFYLGGCAGAFTALIFWAIRRPDRRATQAQSIAGLTSEFS